MRVFRTLSLLLIALMIISTSVQSESAEHSRIVPRYVLRAGDTLSLQFRLTPDLNQTIAVQPDGYISLNVAGEVLVGGLTVPQAHDLILQKLETKLNQPELTLILEEFTHPSIVIAGEVFRPGQIELKEHTTALGAVMLAGGFTESARAGQIVVIRKVTDDKAEVKLLNLAGIHKTSQLDRDIALEAGDMIYVPRDRISKIEHYMKITSTGLFINPLQFVQ